MEFIGKNLPNIQTQYSSTLESVKTGITQTTKARGLAGLDSAFENFRAENIGTTGALDPESWVGNVAQFPDPVTFLQNHNEGLNQTGSPFFSKSESSASMP